MELQKIFIAVVGALSLSLTISAQAAPQGSIPIMLAPVTVKHTIDPTRPNVGRLKLAPLYANKSVTHPAVWNVSCGYALSNTVKDAAIFFDFNSSVGAGQLFVNRNAYTGHGLTQATGTLEIKHMYPGDDGAGANNDLVITNYDSSADIQLTDCFGTIATD